MASAEPTLSTPTDTLPRSNRGHLQGVTTGNSNRSQKKPLIKRGSCGKDENPMMKDQITRDENGQEFVGETLDLEVNFEVSNGLLM